MKDIVQTAQAFREARQNYELSFAEHFAGRQSSLSQDRFWQLQVVFTKQVCQFRFGYERTNGVEQAASEFFRISTQSLHNSKVEYTYEEAVSFVASWKRVVRDLYVPLYEVVTDRSDDAYSDLLDALPLVGRDVVDQLLSRRFHTNTEFEEAVTKSCQQQGYERLADLILHGENYVAMSLYETARHSFLYQLDDASLLA
jgi:hypothetical protein